MMKLRLKVIGLVRCRAGMQTQDCPTPEPGLLYHCTTLDFYRHGNKGSGRYDSPLGTEPVSKNLLFMTVLDIQKNHEKGIKSSHIQVTQFPHY